MLYEGLNFLKGLPSPEGVWDRVQVIGELIIVSANVFFCNTYIVSYITFLVACTPWCSCPNYTYCNSVNYDYLHDI